MISDGDWILEIRFTNTAQNVPRNGLKKRIWTFEDDYSKFRSASSIYVSLWKIIKYANKYMVQNEEKKHCSTCLKKPFPPQHQLQKPKPKYWLRHHYSLWYIMIYQIFCKLFALARLRFLPDNFFSFAPSTICLIF